MDAILWSIQNRADILNKVVVGFFDLQICKEMKVTLKLVVIPPGKLLCVDVVGMFETLFRR